MTLVAGIVDVQTRELGYRRLAVHVVATATIHFAFEERMRERLARFTALGLMAVVAHIRLGRRVLNRITRRMANMTVRAAHLVAGMRTVVPTDADVALMAVQAHAVLSRYVCLQRSEIRYLRALLASTHTTRVRVARSVASLTLQLAMTEGTRSVGRNGMRRSKDR